MPKTITVKNTSPQDLEKAFNHACLLHENVKLEEALTEYKKLLILLPQFSLLLFNCGLVLFELEQFLEAEEHYKKAVESCDDDPDIHYNRGLNYRRLQNFQEAAYSFEMALKLGDTSIDTLYNLALCNQDMDKYTEAERLYMIIIKQRPDHLSSLNNYAYLCHKSGDTEKAKKLYRQLLEYNPSHQAAGHMLDSLSGRTPETAPIDYVESVFDNYAKEFEQSLVNKLEYKTPTALRSLFEKHHSDTQAKHILDLGCGTGLAGVEFKDYGEELTGIDISNKMLKVAAEKSVYQHLLKDDILNFIQQDNQRYDLILAADVFTYMGNLQNVFIGCAAITTSGGFFLFSVEESESNTYSLKPTGRFGHSKEYICDLSVTNGWNILETVYTKLRKDKGKWIYGFLFLLQK